MNKIKYILIFVFTFFSVNIYASSNIILEKADINLESKQSLQRGARIFFSYCQGCHSIKYMRYSDLATGIGLKSIRNKSIEMVIKETLMHSVDDINENSVILSSMDKESGVKWFGKVPPDLSLISRYRGVDWLYTYMRSFYKDDSRPWGVNNLLFPDVGMPHILLKYQGVQILKDNIGNFNTTDDLLELVENGEFSINEYNKLVKDLVTFLSYVGEPIQTERKDLVDNVLIFLLVFCICMFLLKKEYWKDIK